MEDRTGWQIGTHLQVIRDLRPLRESGMTHTAGTSGTGTEWTAGDLATEIDAVLRGDASRILRDAAPFDQAGETDITFVTEAKYLEQLNADAVGAIVLTEPLADQIAESSATLLIVEDPHQVFLTVVTKFRPERQRKRIGCSPAAHIAPSATIGTDTNVHPGAVIGEDVVIGSRCDIHSGVVIEAGCKIGDDCVIFPNAVLYADVVVANRVRIHANAVIGADGFGYRLEEGRHAKVPQLGWVELHDDVEIGSCTTIDRGAVGATIIGEGSKIDNLVQIAHNCRLGKHNVIVGQVGFAGSVTTGSYVVCAGQVGIADHVHLGDGAVFGSKAGVHKDMPGGETYLGTPAEPAREAMRHIFAARQVPALKDQLKTLSKQVAELQRQLSTKEKPLSSPHSDAA